MRLRLRRADHASRCSPPTRSSTCTRRCCRAGAARRRSSGRSWPATRRRASRSCASPRALDSGPVCLQEREPIRARRRLRRRWPRGCSALGGELLVRALDERPPFVEQDEARRRPTRTRSRPRDRALDPRGRRRRSSGSCARCGPHIGARLPLPGRRVPGRGRARAVDGDDARAGRRPRARRRRAAAARLQRRRARADRDPAARRRGRWRARRLAARPPRPGADRLLARPAAARAPARRAGRARGRASGTPTPSGRRYLAALAWRGDEAVLAARARAARRATTRAARGGRRLRARPARRCPERTFPAEQRRRARGAWRRARRTRRCSPTIASAFGHLGEPYGTRDAAAAAPPRRRRASARASPTRSPAATTSASFDALVELTADPEPATSATGPRSRSARSSPQDTPTLRDALAARLDDPRRRARASRPCTGWRCAATRARSTPALDLLGEVGPHDDGGNAADTIWKRYALTQATVRLAALTGDARLKEHLPALDERLMGTAIEGDLRTAYDRVGDAG